MRGEKKKKKKKKKILNTLIEHPVGRGHPGVAPERTRREKQGHLTYKKEQQKVF